MINSIDHANHNCETHALLLSNPGHEDWVITVAFYAALHFLRHKIFPLEVVIGETTYNCGTFDEYYGILKKPKPGKHGAMRNLVELKSPIEVSTAYNQLMDLCFTSRYNSYIVSPPSIILGSECLDTIRLYANS